MGGALAHLGEPFVASINGCARCRGEGHNNLVWHPLRYPVEWRDTTIATHWAFCPELGEPILMVATETE